MFYLFANQCVQPASVQFVELAACRQLKHLTDDHRTRVIRDTYLWMAECWMGRPDIKHPDPSNLCANCGKPRSKHSLAANGLCFKCYAVKGGEERDLWTEDVFWTAVEIYGFTCDACGQNYKPNNSPDCRAAATCMLESRNGLVRPVLCYPCTSDFKSFASRNYGRGSWQSPNYRAVEKIALAWLAQKVKVLAERKASVRNQFQQAQ